MIWMYGNDFQTWENPDDDGVVLAVANGIKSVDLRHIHATELNYPTSGSLDDTRWEALVELDGAYTYYHTYARVLTEYNRRNLKPIFMEEASYKFEHNANTDGGSLRTCGVENIGRCSRALRDKLHGSKYTWALPTGWFSSWRSHLDTPGVTQLGYMKNLFARLRWYDLVPDQIHTVVTDGYGTPATLGTGSVATDTYATAAASSGRQISHCIRADHPPNNRGYVQALGSDRGSLVRPGIGEYIKVGGSLFSNTGSTQFTPPGKNHDRDGDWVLVLEAS